MKKTATALFLCLLIIGINAKSQLSTAIAGGAHMASVPGKNNPGWDAIDYDYTYRSGFHIGLMADLPLSGASKFSLQPGMFFTNKGHKFSTSYDTTSAVSSIDARQFVNYLEIPVNLVYKMDISRKTRMIFGGGPYLSFLYNGWENKNTRYKSGTENSTDNRDLRVPIAQGKYNNVDYGVNALFGFEFGRVFLTANYSQGLGDFYEPNTRTGSFRHKVMGATLGIFLSNPAKRQERLKDRDRDGLADSEDNCPKQKGTVATNGCPDKDADGIADQDDTCPELAGTSKSHGCPTHDSDNDGITDDKDKCPYDKGIKSKSGCPEDIKAITGKIESFAGRIQFRYRSSTLTSQSKNLLDAMARVLKHHKKLNVSIEGYTSSDGNPRNHMKLSQARAESVRKYLEASGIKGTRLTATGLGEENPLNKGKTEAERALNRRVEVKFTN